MGVLLAALGAASTLGWLGETMPLRSADIAIEASGAAGMAVLLGPLLAGAGALWAISGGRAARFLLPAAGSLAFSLGFLFAIGGAGYDDRTGAAAPIQLFYCFSTALGALLALAGMASSSRDLDRVELGPALSRLMAAPLVIASAVLAWIWATAIASILATGTCSHIYYRAGSYTFFWGTVVHDTLVITAIYLPAAALLALRHTLAPKAAFFAASYLAAHFGPAIAIEIQRFRARGEVDAPLLIVSLVLTAASIASALVIARRALLPRAERAATTDSE
jgi:hypothetical protein